MSYSCCNLGFLNVDIDADTSKLQAKEERNSMNGGLRGISQSKTHFTDTIFSFSYQKLYFSIQTHATKTIFFIQLSKAIFIQQRVSYEAIIISN